MSSTGCVLLDGWEQQPRAAGFELAGNDARPAGVELLKKAAWATASPVHWGLMAEHHTPTPSVPTRRRVMALAGLAGVVAVTGAGATKVVAAHGEGRTNCSAQSVVQVAAPAAIADAVRHAADQVEARGDVCASYSVSSQNPGDTYQSIITSSPSEPQVWISDSPAWTQLIEKKLGSGWVTTGDTIATSPVVMGVPASLRSAAKKPNSWLSVLDNKLPVSFIDTDVATESLLAVVAADQQANTNDARSDLMRAVLRLSRSLTTAATMDGNALQGADRARIYPVSEQQMLAFNKAHPDKPLTPMVPTGGAKQLEYQWVTPVRGTQADSAALDALKQQLLSPAEKTYRSEQGFRNGGSDAPAGGSVLPASLPMMAPASQATTVSADTAWTNLKKDARMLVLIDVSGSMQTKIDGGQSRIELMESTAIAALDVLPKTTRLGAWAFSSDLQKNHVDYLPLTNGEQPILDDTYRNGLIAKAHTLPGLAAKNGDTALYDTIAAAYKSVTDTYDPNYVNSVVVLTDGTNDDPNGGLSLDQLLARLKSQYSADKPVKIVTISLGTGTDPDALKRIAKATDGLSYQTKTPEQISGVFVDAFLRRSDY